MGVSLVLELMGKVEHPMDGMQAAATIIDNGAALNYLNNFKEYFDKSCLLNLRLLFILNVKSKKILISDLSTYL